MARSMRPTGQPRRRQRGAQPQRGGGLARRGTTRTPRATQPTRNRAPTTRPTGARQGPPGGARRAPREGGFTPGYRAGLPGRMGRPGPARPAAPLPPIEYGPGMLREIIRRRNAGLPIAAPKPPGGIAPAPRLQAFPRPVNPSVQPHARPWPTRWQPRRRR